MQSDARDIQSWCNKRLADPADDLYHAVLFTPHRLRSNVRAIAALFVELEAITTRFRDLNVARTKLAWWHDELERLHTGAADHPVTRMLADDDHDPSNLMLADLVTGMELILLEGPVTDLAAAHLQAERGLARLAVVLARLVTSESGATGDYAPLGTAVGLMRLVGTNELDDATRQTIATAACKLLSAESRIAIGAPAPLRVLAALAWRKAILRVPSVPRQHSGPRRVVTAWRAARGHLPHEMNTG
jgi:hypothetical protein